jgi:predicted site-specific integrase-resolvase
MSLEDNSKPKRRLRTRSLCERYDIVGRTVDRWVEQGILPPPMKINGRRFWDEDEIEQRERDGMRPRKATAVAP